MTEDTIAAIATANGIGSISIVRVSGDNAYNIALEITKQTRLVPRVATLSKLYDNQSQLIDESIVIFFKNPHSFTGENIIEFQCHGGTAVASIVLDTILTFGARIANPGEFSKRAFLNGKIDLTQAQAISKLIEAKSADAVRLLAKQLKGELKDFVEDIRKDLLFMLAYTEVNIDYAEEDLPSDIFEQIKIKLENIEIKLNEALESSKRREGMIDGFKLSIIGKPNVGKSSLLNKLLNFNRAIVSNIAGTTRDTIEENVKIGTHILKVVDTAGIREANDEIEKIGIEKSLEAIKSSDIVVAIFDGSIPFDDEDKQILNLCKDFEKELIIIVNKSDLTQLLDLNKLTNTKPIFLNTKESIEPFISKISNILDTQAGEDSITLVSKQQIDEVKNTLYEIIKSNEPLKTGELEFFAYHINNALLSISNITRPYQHSDILDTMFGEFCLGK